MESLRRSLVVQRADFVWLLGLLFQQVGLHGLVDVKIRRDLQDLQHKPAKFHFKGSFLVARLRDMMLDGPNGLQVLISLLFLIDHIHNVLRGEL